MQKGLKGTQLRMKRFRGMPLKQALGDLAGRKRLSNKLKAEKKKARIELRDKPKSDERKARLEARRKSS